MIMDKSVPVSYLRDYNKALSLVAEGSHVYLTKNGATKYVVVDAEEWQEKQAALKLLRELQRGYQSLATEKTLTPEELAQKLGIKL
jgi:PHD/YefM family antitoxin component YafN of YafNO toxin-antitoxin module